MGWRHKRPVLLAAIIMTAALGAAFGLMPANERLPGVTLVKPSVPLHDIHLTTGAGEQITGAFFQGRWTLMYLGFTSCPDICPATLRQLAALKRRFPALAPGAPAPQLLFVSVDPRRDAGNLARYTAYFHPDLIGATGDLAALQALERQIGASHSYERDPSGEGYTVSHSAEVFMISPRGRLVARLQPPLPVQGAAKRYAWVVQHAAAPVHESYGKP